MQACTSLSHHTHPALEQCLNCMEVLHMKVVHVAVQTGHLPKEFIIFIFCDIYHAT